MYFFIFHATPNSNNIEDVAGAYISCWINSDNINTAEGIARKQIANNDWEIISLDENYFINKEDYNENSEGLKYYEQALIDNWVINIHMYPKD